MANQMELLCQMVETSLLFQAILTLRTSKPMLETQLVSVSGKKIGVVTSAQQVTWANSSLKALTRILGIELSILSSFRMPILTKLASYSTTQ